MQAMTWTIACLRPPVRETIRMISIGAKPDVLKQIRGASKYQRFGPASGLTLTLVVEPLTLIGLGSKYSSSPSLIQP